MANNNWNVASKVRKNLTFSKIPVIGDYINVKLRGSDLIMLGSGGAICWSLWQYFPSTQILQAILAVLATLFMTIYLVLRDSANPEKTNLEIMATTLIWPKKKHFKKLTMDQLEN